MKKTYELNYGNKATINTGNYENLSPMFNIKVVLEGVEKINEVEEFERIKKIVDGQLYNSIEQVRQDQLLKSLKHIRITEKDGVKYPHVTSIIRPDPLEGIPNLELYGLRGDILHEVFQTIVKDGGYVSPFDDERLAPIGGLKDFDLEWIVDNRDFEFGNSEVEIFNTQDIYTGRYDADGLYQSKKAMFDLKSGNLTKKTIDDAFMQIAAYSQGLDIEVMVIIPCNPKIKKEPIVSKDIGMYYAKFKQKRIEFKERFGI